jgi:hypothetical protein
MLLALVVDLVLRGTVRDQSGLPVPRALVYVDCTQLSTDCDSAGHFELTVSPSRAGVLTVYRDGFDAVSFAFDPLDPLTLEPLQIVLVPAALSEMVTVAAPRTPAPAASTFAMRPLDVVRTPGAISLPARWPTSSGGLTPSASRAFIVLRSSTATASARSLRKAAAATLRGWRF